MPKCSITNNGNGLAEICLYDEIDSFFGVGARQFNEQLTALGDVHQITLRINSPGGSVWEGMAVLAMLQNHKAKIITRVEGIAASMASVVAMAGDVIEMPENAFMMIHNPADYVGGGSEDMRKKADVLDQVKAALVGIYAQRTGRTPEEIVAWMDDETWMDGATCLERGFCTNLLPSVTIAASITDKRFRNTPVGLIQPLTSDPQPLPPRSPKMSDITATPVAATLKQLKAACPGADNNFLVAQQEADATIEQAATAYMVAQQAKITDLENQVKSGAAAGHKPGVSIPTGKKAKGKDKPVDDDEDKQDSSGPIDLAYSEMEASEVLKHFDAAVNLEMRNRVKTGRVADRRDVVMFIANKLPQLHQAWLVACNTSKVGRRLIEEKYDRLPAAK